MGGFVAPLATSLGGASGILGSVVSTVLSSALAPGAPSPAAPPAPPPVQAAPEPAPAVEKVDDAKEPVVDTEAARIRASKRRKAAEDKQLFALSEDSNDSVILTKSLLGE